jgi:hypothetical protein
MENYCLSRRLRKQNLSPKPMVKIYRKYKKERNEEKKIVIIFKTIFFI